MKYRKVNLIEVGEQKYVIIIEIIYFKIGLKEMWIYRNGHSIYLACDYSPCDAEHILCSHNCGEIVCVFAENVV